ncbi:phytanoyl-CoA dioxygenase family protein [Methylophilus sp. OH31]|uniref:phytanoyl-CoA dioxygenase family protein n=1 Tax=Methylophilus sp. OH31 TaxID=1387312 RepID=UPI000462FC74|nr:phytanoyl-CoA dioxygenase family protein [Methylophilus sp. OH31]
MNTYGKRPNQTYGVLQKNTANNDEEIIIESLHRNGFALLDSGYTDQELNELDTVFNRLRKQYIEQYDQHLLSETGELYTIRSPLTQEIENHFLNLALNSRLATVIGKMIQGKYILNQQNGVIFPSSKDYDQGQWHRDLPYQHYVSSSPLALNALFCLDDLTFESGAMWVVPHSHKDIVCPSENFIKEFGIQIESKRGQFVILDCMVYHCGGYNQSSSDVRAVNHVFTIPYFKQQINIPQNIQAKYISPNMREILGFNFEEPTSIESYLQSRQLKKLKK